MTRSRTWIVCGLSGLDMRMTIFPLKRLVDCGVTVAADADTAALLARFGLPVVTLGRSGELIAEVTRRLHEGSVTLAFLPSGGYAPLAAVAYGLGVQAIKKCDELLEAVEVLEAETLAAAVVGQRLSRGPRLLPDVVAAEHVPG